MAEDQHKHTNSIDSLARWFKVFAAAALAALLAVSIGIFVVYQVSHDQRARDEQARVERSVGSCKQQNASFIKEHNAFVRNVQETFTLIKEALDSPESKKFIQDIIDSYDENIVPLRDCTPAGIEKYLRGIEGG